MNGTIELRPIVKWFAEQMELQLRANDWKGGWDDCPLAYLNGRLREETVELKWAIFPPSEADREQVAHEAADVANFAMMIADIVDRRGLSRLEGQPSPERPSEGEKWV